MNLKKVIKSDEFLIGLFIGFVLTLSVTGYIITVSFYPKELIGKEAYIDRKRSKVCDKLTNF